MLYARRQFKKAQDMRTKAFRFLVWFEAARLGMVLEMKEVGNATAVFEAGRISSD